MNPLLSIVIPTYERVESLRINLPSILEDASQFSIAVYISDDSRSEDVAACCSELKKTYGNIFYIKNQSRLGHDGNFLAALRQGNSEYTWILGDRVALRKGAIKTLFDVIDKNEFDIISVNKVGRNINFDTGYYDNSLTVLKKFGWHLTYTGATVYSRRVVNKSFQFDLDRSKNFPQVALIFNYLSGHCSFFWINDLLVEGVASTQSYWTSNAFSVFIEDWENVISRLPEIYSAEVKDDIMLAHSRNTQLFSSKFIMKLRAEGHFDSKTLEKYGARILAHSGLGYFHLYCLSIFPRWVLKLLKRLVS